MNINIRTSTCSRKFLLKVAAMCVDDADRAKIHKVLRERKSPTAELDDDPATQQLESAFYYTTGGGRRVIRSPKGLT